MVTVALAGGSSGMGRTMLWTFIRHNNKKHKLVLLSRGPKPEFASKGVDVRPVDYTNHSQLVEALRDVHTVLSVLGGSVEGVKDSQLALIRAAEDAGVKRFAPSEYAGNGYDGVDLYAPKDIVWEAAKKSSLEVTRFNCGLFMGVLATGTPKPISETGRLESRETGEEEALAGLRPWKFVVDLVAGTADYPGDGTAPLVLTDMRDVSLFVLRALDLETWPEDLGIRGDVRSFREIVEICERVQGRKWLTKNNSFAEMEKMADTNDYGAKFYNQTRLAMAKGWCMVGDDLNKAFPDMKPISCEEFVEKWWQDVKVGEAKWVDASQPDPF